jgi:hypothetical protein
MGSLNRKLDILCSRKASVPQTTLETEESEIDQTQYITEKVTKSTTPIKAQK